MRDTETGGATGEPVQLGRRRIRSLEDLKTLTDDERQMLREVKEAVLRFAPDAQVILYGSTARGERQRDSDYDVLVLLPEKLCTGEEDRLRSSIYRVAFDHDRLVSVMIETRQEWESPVLAVGFYHRNVESEGVVL